MYKSKFLNDPYFLDIMGFFHGEPNCCGKTTKTTKRTNVTEDDESYQIEVAIPGLSKEDIDIKVKDSIISISHEKENDIDDEGFFFTDSFNKEYTLPDDVNIKTISAKVENGVLLVTIPKDKKKTNERVIKIE